MISYQTVTIANGAPSSNSIPIRDRRVIGVIFPAEWTAADLTFDINIARGSTIYAKVIDRAGAAYKIAGVATAAAEMRLIAGDANQADIFITGIELLRVSSTNTASEADVNQGAARTLVIVMADV